MFSFIRNSANQQTRDETLLVATYELGSLIKCHHYMKRYGPQGYMPNAKGEMSDLISMLRMYSEQMEWNFSQLMKDGEERYMERMDDLRKHGKEEKNVHQVVQQVTAHKPS